MTEQVFFEFAKEGHPRRIHYVKLPAWGERGAYTQRISLDAMRKALRLQPANGHRYHLYGPRDDYELLVKCMEEKGHTDGMYGKPTHEPMTHNDLTSFQTAIGYRTGMAAMQRIATLRPS